jgi:hypothetical protein
VLKHKGEVVKNYGALAGGDESSPAKPIKKHAKRCLSSEIWGILQEAKNRFFFDKQEQMCLEGEGEGEGLTSPTCIRSV